MPVAIGFKVFKLIFFFSPSSVYCTEFFIMFYIVCRHGKPMRSLLRVNAQYNSIAEINFRCFKSFISVVWSFFKSLMMFWSFCRIPFINCEAQEKTLKKILQLSMDKIPTKLVKNLQWTKILICLVLQLKLIEFKKMLMVKSSTYRIAII